MEELRSRGDVRLTAGDVFAWPRKVAPDTISDRAELYKPPPPADNLGLARSEAPPLITACAVRLLGRKICGTFASHVVSAESLEHERFGPLVDHLHDHFNSIAQSAVFLAICAGLLRDPHDVTTATPIDHVDEPGQLAFLMRIRDHIRANICAAGFDFSQTRGADLIGASTIGDAMDKTVLAIAEAINRNGCFS
jgi:hypothetical protein